MPVPNVSNRRGSVTSTSPQRKKTVGIFATRDSLFQRLVQESATPSPSQQIEIGNRAATGLFDLNEFADEYAERATSGRGEAADNPPSPRVSGTTRGGNLQGAPGVKANAGPSRTNSAGSPTSGRLYRSNAISLGPGAAPSPGSTNPKVSLASAVPARKNGRKKNGADLTNAGHAFRPYVGDMFGTRGDYVDGMVYMSRMKRSYQATFGNSQGGARRPQIIGDDFSAGRVSWGDLPGRTDGRGTLKDALSDARSVASSTGLNGHKVSRRTSKAVDPIKEANTGDDDESHLDDEQRQRRRQRQRCSLTLSNWSANPANARQMVQENVVEALLLLCRGDDDDRVTRLNCVTTLMNLSHVVELRAQMIQQGAAQTLTTLVDASDDRTMRTACAIALCNLCGVDGQEEVLVAHGAASALALLINEYPRVARICRGALFNLTCVPAPYTKIESVLKVFLSLAAACASSPPAPNREDADLLTARALCNLSLFKRLRFRLLEEGVVAAISAMLHPSVPLIQELLSYVLLHLASTRSCRSDLVSKGGLGALVALTGATNLLSTKLLIGSALWHLSKEGELALRMVSEGLLLLINELVRGVVSSNSVSTGEALLTVCANTLYNVSNREDARVKLAERDAVGLLSSISNRVVHVDARKLCTLALCNLLSVQQAAGEILKTGAVGALISLSSSTTEPPPLATRRLFARALHGLCDRATTRVAVLEAGVVSALMSLSDIGTEAVENEHVNSLMQTEVRARCTAALASLSADPRTAAHVYSPAVVRCVAQILARERGNVVIERFCCASLSLLCRDESCALLVAGDDDHSDEIAASALSTVLSTCVQSRDRETKASGCHVLASLSCHASCGASLVRAGTVAVLTALASVKEDPTIPRCCAVALANLSAEPPIRPVLVAAGAVALLSRLSNSYSEDSQRDCATVLCNLSCIPGGEATLATEGAVRVLLMISMVRAVSLETKETCLRALLNLLNAETIKIMVGQEGIVKVLPVFAGLSAARAPSLVALFFSKLLSHPIGRNALCAERTALHSLFQLVNSHTTSWAIDPELQCSVTSLHQSLLSDLVFYENSRALSVQVGIVDALNKVAADQLMLVEGDEDSESVAVHRSSNCNFLKLATILCTLAKHPDTRVALASSPVMVTTLTRFLEPHPPVTDCQGGECATVAVATLCMFGWHEDTREYVATPDVARSLVQLLRVAVHSMTACGSSSASYFSPDTIKSCMLTLCCLSYQPDLLAVMIADGIITSLHGMLMVVAQQRKQTNQSSVCTEFVALGCILFRLLSHVPAFATSDQGQQHQQQRQQLVEVFCEFTTLAVEKEDVESCLDCADALCSIAFTGSNVVTTGGASPTSSVLRQNRQRKTSNGASAVSPSRFAPPKPSSALVTAPVISSIALLMTDNQRSETRWRCCASLWALSNVPEYRRELVDLGCTRLLVSEAYRAVESVSLSTLQCCAAALSNLTLGPTPGKPGDVADTMVAEGAVPALIALGQSDSDSVREYCTIALSNLSGPSPTVDAGSVSALLTLSLGSSGSPTKTSTSSAGLQSAPIVALSRPASTICLTAPQVLCRPPAVCSERHKLFESVIPNFELKPADEHYSLHERKFESDLAASTPPPPRMPAFSAVEVQSDVDDQDPSHQNVNGDHQSNASEFERSTSATHREPASDPCDSIEVPQATMFPKIDPADSMLAMSVAEGGEEMASQSDGMVTNNQAEEMRDHRFGVSTPTIDENGDGDGDGSSSSPPRAGSLRSSVSFTSQSGTTSPALASLSSLARVVGKKTQAVAAVKKLKEVKARSHKSLLGSGSLPCLPTMQRSGSDATLKRTPFQSSGSATAPGDGEQAQQREEPDPRAAIAAAAAAARLYNAPPASTVPHSVTASASTDAPVATVEEFQRRARTLGLWS